MGKSRQEKVKDDSHMLFMVEKMKKKDTLEKDIDTQSTANCTSLWLYSSLVDFCSFT